MDKRILVLFLLFLVTSQHAIQHVVVLMQENRSFDHYLGFMKRENSEIQGLTGTESNPYNVSDPNGSKITVTEDAPYVSPWDPCHGLPCVNEQIFGNLDATGSVEMDGFVQNAIREHKGVEPNVVLRMFTPDKVPILSGLAREYALFDQWFASVPGPTYPNRRFLHAGTSYGSLNNDDWYKTGFPIPTIYEQVLDVNLTTGIYFLDHSPYCDFSSLRTPRFAHIFHQFDQFHVDAANGNLPNYTFIHPRFFPTEKYPSNDQHPDHSVLEGEMFIKSIYESIRSSPNWNETLFIIMYDEHGGFYDHFPTPTKDIPNPDGKYAPDFDFKRLGIRIPVVMISPWINKGTLVHRPSIQNRPFASSEFDHTSVLATMKKLFGFKTFLSEREKWAGTFEDVFSQRKEPRTDCPEKLADLSHLHGEEHRKRIAKEEMDLPINGLQKEIMVVQQCTNPDMTEEEMNQLTQGEAAIIMQEGVEYILNRKRKFASQ